MIASRKAKELKIGLLFAAVMLLSSSVAAPAATSSNVIASAAAPVLLQSATPPVMPSAATVSGDAQGPAATASPAVPVVSSDPMDGQSISAMVPASGSGGVTVGAQQVRPQSPSDEPGVASISASDTQQVSPAGVTLIAYNVPAGAIVQVSGTGQVRVSVGMEEAVATPPGATVVSGSYSRVVSGGIDPADATGMATEYSFSWYTDAIPRLWLDTARRRSRSQIYIEIVELLARGPMTPFEITFYVRLNHKRTKQYLEFLERSGYLQTFEEDGRVRYTLTSNGKSFMERLRLLFEVEQSPAAVRRSSYT